MVGDVRGHEDAGQDAPRPLPLGARLWLPPIHGAALLDRSRRSRVILADRRWDDGSSRIDPPALMAAA